VRSYLIHFYIYVTQDLVDNSNIVLLIIWFVL